jgi:serine/threonine-protein kinase
MPLNPGFRLGAYEIQAPLGAGGMGEVYRARDTKLSRDVALKVLPAAFTSDPERLARFRREAQVLAALDHPNIGAIYGFEDSAGVHALVLQLVDGPTLAERITHGAIPIDEALPIARQIADALEAAHEQGIIHRDLKPANIKLRPDGTVKVLDFGLAKLIEPGSGIRDSGSEGRVTLPAQHSASPTITSPALMTGVGVLLGTAAYMSPEQAKGRPADTRSDIWAFGCVLYEMVAGTRAFAGEDVSDTLAFVLTREPDWTALPANTPPTIRRLLSRCVQKDRKRRLHDIADARLDLDEASCLPQLDVVARSTTSPIWKTAAPWALVALVSAIAGVLAWRVGHSSAPAPAAARFAVTLEGATPSDALNPSEIAVSRDGRRFVYAGERVGTTALFLRDIDQLEPRPLPGTEGAVNPFFSPSGEWVGFFSGAGTSAPRLKKISIRGGSPITLCDAPVPVGGTWGTDDVIYFGPSVDWLKDLPSLNTGWSLSRISAKGGSPHTVLVPDPKRGETRFAWPELLPGGKALLFSVATSRNTFAESHIAVLSLDTGEYHTIVEQGHHPKYLPSGHIVYALNGSLMAVPFDLNRLETTGSPVQMVEDVRARAENGQAQFGVSPTGVLVYVTGPDADPSQRNLVWVDRTGHEEIIAAPPRAYTNPRISPDGRQIAVDVRDQQSDIWIWDIQRQTLQRLTTDPADDQFATWMPDGHHVVYASGPGPIGFALYRQASDGSGARELLSTSAAAQVPEAVTPDGTRIVVRTTNAALAGAELQTLTLGAKALMAPLIRTSFLTHAATVSPDGRWLAFESDESGKPEVWVRPFPKIDAGRWQVSSDGGTRPTWSRDGKELLYLVGGSGSVRLMSVPVQAPGAGFSFGTAQMVFGGPYFAGTVFSRNYDISPDGRRVVMVKRSNRRENVAATRLVVVLNWFEELKLKVPASAASWH